MPLSSSEFATVERPSTNSRIFAHTRWDGIINGWKVGSIFGDRAFYNGDWLKRAAAAKGGIYTVHPKGFTGRAQREQLALRA